MKLVHTNYFLKLKKRDVPDCYETGKI